MYARLLPLLLVACAGRHPAAPADAAPAAAAAPADAATPGDAPPAPPAAPADTRVATLRGWTTVRGPWSSGSYVDLAAGPDGAVHAVWIAKDGTLRWAVGPDWGRPETVAERAEAGDGGQIRPEIELDAAGKPAVLYAVGQRTWLARRGDGGWTRAEVAGGKGASALADLAVAGGEPVVAWLDTRVAPKEHVSALYVGAPGAEVEVYRSGTDGVCMCCRPALLERPEGLTAAVRDADGPRRDIRLLVREGSAWKDRGDATTGRWSPGGCPADGPVLAADALYVSDARDGKRRVYRVDAAGETLLPLLDPAREAVQPRVTPDGRAVFWIEVEPGTSELVTLEGGAPVSVAKVEGGLEVGDPVAVGREVWIPQEAGGATVLVGR